MRHCQITFCDLVTSIHVDNKKIELISCFRVGMMLPKVSTQIVESKYKFKKKKSQRHACTNDSLITLIHRYMIQPDWADHVRDKSKNN